MGWEGIQDEERGEGGLYCVGRTRCPIGGTPNPPGQEDYVTRVRAPSGMPRLLKAPENHTCAKGSRLLGFTQSMKAMKIWPWGASHQRM